MKIEKALPSLFVCLSWNVFVYDCMFAIGDRGAVIQQCSRGLNHKVGETRYQ